MVVSFWTSTICQVRRSPSPGREHRRCRYCSRTSGRKCGKEYGQWLARLAFGRKTLGGSIRYFWRLHRSSRSCPHTSASSFLRKFTFTSSNPVCAHGGRPGTLGCLSHHARYRSSSTSPDTLLLRRGRDRFQNPVLVESWPGNHCHLG